MAQRPQRGQISQWISEDQEITPPPTAHGSTPAVGGSHHADNHTEDLPLEDQPFYKRLALLGRKHIFAERKLGRGIFDIEKPPPHSYIYDIELATLQRMVIHDLQHKLVAIVKRIHGQGDTNEKDMEKARKLLEDYSTAVHNYDFMFEKKYRAKALGKKDPFRITSEDRLGFILMDEAELAKPTALKRIRKKIQQNPGHDYEDRYNILPLDPRGQLLDSGELAGFYDRAKMGVLGGLAVIVPMLIMVLQNDLLTTLTVTSASTIIFAGVLALLGRELKGETVLASVAAYAAVLVVFIGASS